MKYSERSENKYLKILPKAEKDLLKLAKKHPFEYLRIEELINKHLRLPLLVDGNRIKCFANYKPPLYELRIFGKLAFRAFFRIYSEDSSIELERVITKSEAETILKNYYS